MIPNDIAQTLLSPDGELLCRFLQQTYHLEGKGSSLPDLGDPRKSQQIASLAHRLSLIEDFRQGTLRLTPLGYELATVAKEYCNWIDANRPLPPGVTPDMIRGQRILDVGCSFGRFLIAFARHGATGYGVEIQENHLILARLLAGRENVDPPNVVRGKAEALPFADAQFDLLFCRIVLTYCDIDQALAEFARVVKPGGSLILTVRTLSGFFRTLFKSRWLADPRDMVWKGYALFNTALLQATGKQVRVNVKGRMSDTHSPTYPTANWYRRSLAKAGFDVTPADRGASDYPAGLFHATCVRRTGADNGNACHR